MKENSICLEVQCSDINLFYWKKIHPRMTTNTSSNYVRKGINSVTIFFAFKVVFAAITMICHCICWQHVLS